ncbi:MAG: PEP-CTERM sorting domain-containing protein [Acidobacteriia bacterium]|nr:PEP-CTERM sorting domain-containing protein [Terriglobia bacterium]
MGGFVNPGNVRFDFYSPGDTLLGSVTVAAANGFGGWADPGGISRVRLVDLNQDDSSFFFDSLTVGTIKTSEVPEPSSIVLMGVGLLAMVAGRHARRSRSEV